MNWLSQFLSAKGIAEDGTVLNHVWKSLNCLTTNHIVLNQWSRLRKPWAYLIQQSKGSEEAG